MDDEHISALKDIRAEIHALCETMEAIRDSGTPDHARWVSYKAFASKYNEIANAYTSITSKSLPVFDVGKIKGHTSTIWPIQKEYFETIYLECSSLRGKVNNIASPSPKIGFEDLLHPIIAEYSLKHYKNGDFRNAVLDSILAISDEIRNRTGLDLDGENLCNNAFSAQDPKIIFSEIHSDSGRNDQRGFLDIFKGFYRGVRNPKAHSLQHDLDANKAAQYLILASLLMRRVTEGTLSLPTPPVAAP